MSDVRDIRFYRDADAELAHCYVQHGIHEQEVIEVLRRPGQRFRRSRDGTLVAEGQTNAGRHLRVIYRDDRNRAYLFVITAYDLGAAGNRSYRRRRKRK